MAGRFDLAGVGPGDPELMTIKTMRAIKACQILVLPIGSPELKKPNWKRGKKRHLQKNVWHIGLRVRQSRRRKRSCALSSHANDQGEKTPERDTR